VDTRRYEIEHAERLDTPSLIYFKDIIVENTQKAIALAGGVDRLWPHVKSHKMRQMILLQQSMGIHRFKCSTILEAKMVADCGAEHILLAYPLVGPNLTKFIALQKAYPKSRFYAIGDDLAQLSKLSEASANEGLTTRALLDMDMGMHRTGVSLEKAKEMYERCAALPGLAMAGLHAYDGHNAHPDLETRKKLSRESIQAVHALRESLQKAGVPCDLLVVGGTPSFPVHAEYDGVFLSPGTVFITDARKSVGRDDFVFEPGAAVLTRVISHPAEGTFTLDLGSKAIACDIPGDRGFIIGHEEMKPLFQSEEHWVFSAPKGTAVPAIGELLLVVPTHVCPTSALYPYALVAEGGSIADRWDVTARDRFPAL